MRTHTLFALAGASLTTSFPTQQPLLEVTPPNKALEVQQAFKKAQIIPTVTNDFLPTLSLSITWTHKKHKAHARLGNTLAPSLLDSAPDIKLRQISDAPSDSPSDSIQTEAKDYIIVLTDPDAPSRSNPKWAEVAHWIALLPNVSFPDTSSSSSPFPFFSYRPTARLHIPWFGTTIYQPPPSITTHALLPYKPPAPPKGTGKHRYVFLLFAAANGAHEKLDVSVPDEEKRKGWGYGKGKGGVRKWAGENGLRAVGGEFVYAEHE